MPIELIVRGICTLRPGVPGLSQTITVRSVVGRLKKHSRVFYFANGGDEELYIGSADWLPWIFNRRVEVVMPISDPDLKTYLKSVDQKDLPARQRARTPAPLPYGSYQNAYQPLPTRRGWTASYISSRMVIRLKMFKTGAS